MTNTMIESLECRQMYSATMVSDAYQPPAQEPGALKITLTDVLVSSYSAKVKTQDLNFVAAVNKSNPKLFL